MAGSLRPQSIVWNSEGARRNGLYYAVTLSLDSPLPLQTFFFFLLIDSEITLHEGQLEECLHTLHPAAPTLASTTEN